MIRIFPSKLEGAPLEQHTLRSVTTLDAWMRENVPSYDSARLVVTAHVNGMALPPEAWPVIAIGPADTVDLYPEAKGKVVSTVLNVATLGAWSLVLKLIMPQVASPSTSGTQTGDDLSESSVKGNKVKLNDIIREVAGTRRVYPDYLLPLVRRFEAPREQWTEMLLCVGVGEFDIQPGNVLVGDTPLLSLGADAEYTIYGPGADLSGETAAIWWHSAAEVGATSTGTAGLELTVATQVTQNPTVSSLFFGGYTISAPTAGEYFPASWTAGIILRVLAPYTYTIGAGGLVSGAHIGMLAPYTGQAIEIYGTQNSGSFFVGAVTTGSGGAVTSFTVTNEDGSPVGLAQGTMDLTIGPRGLLFQIASTNDADDTDTQGPSSLQVVRLNSSGAVDASFPGFDTLTTVNGQLSVDASSLTGGNRGPFPACPKNEVCTRIQWDVFFPQGLCGTGREGQVYAINGYHILEYRDMAIGGAWTSIEYVHRNNSLDAVGYTNTLALPYPMRPEVRMRKKFVNQGGASTSEYRDTTQWYGLRADIPVKKVYEGVTTMAVRVRGGDRLASQSEQLISAIVSRRLPRRVNGVWQPSSATRAIDAFAQYIAKSVGYTDADLDLVEFDRLSAVWAARGDWYDDVYSTATTVKDAINRTLGVGFAEMTLDNGRIRPARDEPRSALEHMYTPQNMVDPLTRTVTALTPDDYDGVDVEFTNADTWQVETVECRLPGDAGETVETIQLDGVTDIDRAWRIGMRRRRAQVYRRWTYTFTTELDALNSRYLSYCAIADDVPGYAQTALLLSVQDYGNTLVLESSEPLTIEPGVSYVVALRKPDGRLSGPWPAAPVGDDGYYLSIEDSLDFAPDTSWEIEPPHLLFGPLERFCYRALVTSVQPDETTGAKVEAMTYDARVYADDDGVAP